MALIFSDDLEPAGRTGVLTAAAVMLLSPVASAASNVAVKRWGSGLHPLSLTAVPMGLCALLTGALAVAFERQVELVWSVESVMALIYLGIAGSAVTFTLYFWLLSFVPATRLSLITYAAPVVAVIIGVLWMDEPIEAGMVSGSALILLGTGLAMGGRREDRPGDEDGPPNQVVSARRRIG